MPSFEKREPPRVPEMGRGRPWAELQRARESIRCPLSIPVVVHRDQGVRSMCIGQGRVELQRRVGRPSSMRHRILCRTYSQPRVKPDIAFSECGVRRGEAGIASDGFAEVRNGLIHRMVTPFVQGVHPLEVSVVGPDVHRRAPSRRSNRSPTPELVNDRRRNLVLNRKHV